MEFINKPIEAPFVIFGTTAEGITNPVPTLAGPKYPHEIQANILHNLITGTAPSQPTWALGVEILATFIGFYFSPLPSRCISPSQHSDLLSVGSLYGAWHAI